MSAQGLHEVLSSWDRLAALELYTQLPWSARSLPSGASLEILRLDAPAVDVTGLGRYAGLRILNLGHRWRPTRRADWEELGRLEHLQELAVPEEVLEELVEHLRLPSLGTLRLYGEAMLSPGLERRLAELFPGAEIEPYSYVYEQ
ncbi:hypothetical protein [Streptomyces yangpuensis]|uniref:hypothetical protein n=1 Tax=Streptomyces yangpuensis TaxID=1648182 RepID=UPI001428BB8C|nr:hypothetical protein [Streptomyces yangpuensis]